MQGFLYEISERYTALEQALEAQTDEASAELIASALAAMDGEIESVCYNGIGFIKGLEARRDGLKAEKKRIDEDIQKAERYIERIKAGYAAFLVRTGRKAVDTDRGTISVPAPSVRTIVDNAALIPLEYKRQKISEEPDRESIKQAIRSGHPVPGAHLEEHTSIRIK